MLVREERSTSIERESSQSVSIDGETKDSRDADVGWDMRSFTAIVCSKCHYLEYPGCDVHGLYTEMLPSGQAKCPNCAATTDNVKPFRDGCRRCRNPTSIYLWHCSVQDVQQALDFFPPSVEEIKYTILQCEHCHSITFPSFRERLTVRTPNCALTGANHRHLKVSHFQRSMTHVKSCPRSGMPVRSIFVMLTVTELTFLLERIQQSPIVQPIENGPQYQSRLKLRTTQVNKLNQVYLKLLSSVVKNYSYDSETVADTVTDVTDVMLSYEPMSIFADWSPPREPPEVYCQPKQAFSSDPENDRYPACRVMEANDSYWRSSVENHVPETPISICLEFDTEFVISSLVVHWNKRYMAAKYSLHISMDNVEYEKVALVNEERLEKRVVINTTKPMKFVKIVMHAAISLENSFAIESIKVYRRKEDTPYVPALETLRDLESWLVGAFNVGTPATRELSIGGLQGLALASGSLCTMLQLIVVLLSQPSDDAEFTADTQQRIVTFIETITAWLKKHQFCDKPTYMGAKAPWVPKVKEHSAETDFNQYPIFRNVSSAILHSNFGDPSSGTRIFQGSLPTLSSLTSTSRRNTVNLSRGSTLVPNASLSSSAPLVQEVNDGNDPQDDSKPSKDLSFEPFITAMEALSSPKLTKHIKTSRQFAMVLLAILSELSVWQMQRMQKVDGIAENKGVDQESFPLEEAYSIQVCVDLFTVCQTLLRTIVSESPEGSENYMRLKKEALALSEDAIDCGLSFSPETMGLSVLQIITANLRRLVLSRVNPQEVGINPVPTTVEDPDALTSSQELSPMLETLETLISTGAKQTDKLFPLSLQAAAAVEVGMEALYPSAELRTRLLTSRMGKGATLEFQFRWPAAEGDHEDPRYERLLLLLQLEFNRSQIKHSLCGAWNLFIHLVVMIPEDMDTETVLRKNIADCIQKSGFLSWQLAAGAQEISVTLQRHLHWNRAEKMALDSGSGWIRVYPRAVATFSDVMTEVQSFIDQQQILTPSDE